MYFKHNTVLQGPRGVFAGGVAITKSTFRFFYRDGVGLWQWVAADAAGDVQYIAEFECDPAKFDCYARLWELRERASYFFNPTKSWNAFV